MITSTLTSNTSANRAAMKAKRGQGEGTISKRKDGRWEARITLEGGKRKCFYGASRAEVREKLVAAQRARDQGVPIIADERTTLAVFTAQWLEAKQPPNLEPKTHRRYSELLTLHVLPDLGALPLTRITPQQVQALYAHKRMQLSSTTVRKIHMVLHALLASAVRLDLVTRNITELVDKPRNAPAEIHPLTREETLVFLAAASGHRLEALFVLAVTTGMRQGELLGLHWRDVDLTDGSLQVRLVQQRVNGETIYKKPKTPRSRRRIALTPTAVEALRRHRSRQHTERLRLGDAWAEGQRDEHRDLVFTNPVGQPNSADNVFDEFQRLLKQAGLRAVRFHDLRHTAATLLLGARVNPKIVSEMLGHATVAITLDTYSHVLPDMQQDAAAVLEQLLQPELNTGPQQGYGETK